MDLAIHRRIGSHYATTMFDVMTTQVLSRLPDLELAGELPTTGRLALLRSAFRHEGARSCGEIVMIVEGNASMSETIFRASRPIA